MSPEPEAAVVVLARVIRLPEVEQRALHRAAAPRRDDATHREQGAAHPALDEGLPLRRVPGEVRSLGLRLGRHGGLVVVTVGEGRLEIGRSGIGAGARRGARGTAGEHAGTRYHYGCQGEGTE